MVSALASSSVITRWLKKALVFIVGSAALAVGVAAGSYAYFSHDLPSVEDLRTWRPPQVTKVYCRDGALCAEYYRERRTWVDVQSLPPHVKNAFLAAEDADFYTHEGLDFIGMARSLLKVFKPGSRAGGGSTISQQTCKNLLLTPERSVSRKIKEIILTPRLEKALTKDQILNLYVNSVYFGWQRYGVEEAALFYFGKHAQQLSIGEAAVLAGTVQLPHRINPLTNVVKAKTRQRYVLGQLARHGFLKQGQVEPELDKPIVLGPRPPAPVGQYYVEEIRKQLVDRYGEKAVLEGGLRVDIAMDVKLQTAADAAVKAGLEAVDKRQGYRGPVGTIEQAHYDALKPLLKVRLDEAGRRKGDDVLVADLTALKHAKPPEEEDGSAEADAVDLDEPIASADEQLARAVQVRTYSDGLETVGRVTDIDDTKGTAQVDLVTRTAQLKLQTMSWARPRSEKGKLGAAPQKVSDVLKPGDLVRLKLGKALPGSQTLDATLAQWPAVQGALLAIDPTDRSVVAMVGGYDFASSAFNRAVQARRQPGSSFKPFLYAAAMNEGRYTTLSIVNDAPFTVRDPYTGKSWAPHNYEKGGFEGPMTLRQALTESKNTVSVRLIEAMTPPVVIDFAHKAGIKSELPENLTLALGTGEVTMLEIANAYTTLQTLGQYSEPVMLVKVADHTGTVFEEHHAAPEEVLKPATAYLVTSLMRSVVEQGTAMAVRELERPAAGKTGTANEYRDAWFSGYTADLVASAWVGFDDHEPLGPGETGGRAALPLWLAFMKVAHEGKPVRDFEPPPGVTLARIDPATGLLAGRAVPGRTEPFLEGTAPTAEAPAPGAVGADDFLMPGGRRGGP